MSSSFSPQELNVLLLLTAIFNTISLVLSLLTLLFNLLVKRDYKALSMYFSISAIGMHVALLMTPVFGIEHFQEDSFYCNLQGFLLQWSTLSTGCWIFCLAWQFYCHVVLGKQEFMKPLATHAFSWLLPLVTAVIPLAANKITPRGVWCWVTDQDFPPGVWQWVLFYVPILSFTIVMLYFWVSALIYVWQLLKKHKTRFYFIKNIIGGFFFFASFAFQCAHRLFQSLQPHIVNNGTSSYDILYNDSFNSNNNDNGDFYWLLAHVLDMSLIGTAGFIIYSTNSHNISAVRKLFYNCFAIKSSRRDDYEDLDDNEEEEGKVNVSLFTKDTTDTSSAYN